jgi:hypothetical protein
MNRKTRSNLVLGLLLILIGAWFLAAQFVPGLSWFWGVFDWPLIIVSVGVFLLLLGLVLGAPGMAIPACIVGGIGSLLYWQNATGNWQSWAYAWTLIPGFVGVGLMLSALLGEGWENFRVGAWMSFISLIVFSIAGAMFGARVLGVYWPVLVIAFGVWLLVQPLFKRRPPAEQRDEPEVLEQDTQV